MTQKTTTVTLIPEVYLSNAPGGGSSTTLGVYKQIVQIIRLINK